MTSYRTGRFFGRWASYILLATVSLVMIFPFIWMVFTAFKGNQEVYVYPPTFFPQEFHWDNFSHVLETVPFVRFYFNSLLVTILITVSQVITSALAAYAFARLEFFGRDFLFILYLATLVIPNQVTMLPLFLLVSRLGWIDTYQALVVPFLANAFAVFFLRQFFAGLPRELEDAARVDGAGRLRILMQIILPLARPALATITLFIFLSEWDSYLWPLIVTNTQAMRTLPIGLRFFVEESGAQLNYMMAGALMAVIPIILLFFAAQRQFIEGIAMTGTKG
ncbi:MAG: carbohydrate ABC transporter permease [Anaerolineaceae bacterium]|nr:carbohydrate ABC transporter permease [Anaerolineaceae bacterium]